MFEFLPGQLGGVDGSDRLTVPVDILRAVKWWKSETIEVLAELVRPGLIRIFLASDAMPKVEELRKRVTHQELNSDIRFERLQIIADRYRSLKMYADGRVRFTKEVSVFLGFSLGQQPTLYVQPFQVGLEIMSLAYREKRILDEGSSNLIGLHLDASDEN